MPLPLGATAHSLGDPMGALPVQDLFFISQHQSLKGTYAFRKLIYLGMNYSMSINQPIQLKHMFC